MKRRCLAPDPGASEIVIGSIATKAVSAGKLATVSPPSPPCPALALSCPPPPPPPNSAVGSTMPARHGIEAAAAEGSRRDEPDEQARLALLLRRFRFCCLLRGFAHRSLVSRVMPVGCYAGRGLCQSQQSLRQASLTNPKWTPTRCPAVQAASRGRALNRNGPPSTSHNHSLTPGGRHSRPTETRALRAP